MRLSAPNLSRLRLSRITIAFGAMVIVTLIALAVCATVMLRDNEIAAWRTQLHNLTLTLAEHTHQNIASANLALDSIVGRLHPGDIVDAADLRRRAGSPSMFALLRDTVAGLPQVDVATIVAANGDIVNYSRAFPPPPINIADREYFREIAANPTPGLFISHSVRNKGTGQWTFYLTRRLDDARGRFLGVAQIGIAVDSFANFHERLGQNLGEGASITMLRGDYTLLTRWPRSDELIGERNIAGTTFNVVSINGKRDDVIYSDGPRFSDEKRKVARLAAVRVVEGYPLMINITVTEDLFLAGWGRFAAAVAIMTMFAVATLLFGLVFLVRMLKRREVDVSQIREQAAELQSIAHFDTLTGLPNRRLLADRLERALARSRHSGKPLAVCYLDIDGFKPINDHFGHAAGDRLLIDLSRKLSAVLREHDTIARLGGDEFVLLLTDLSRPEECHAVLDRVLAAASTPIVLDGIAVAITASVGVSLSPPDEADADTLLRHADQAMYRAKEAGKNRCHMFDPEHDRQIKAHHHQLQRLRDALERREFVLHYQPKVDLATGEVAGAEALLRWRHPDEGLLLPEAFLRHIEGSDLEIALGEWVIDTVLRQIAAWHAGGVRVVTSLNVSANHLLQPGFAERLRAAMEPYPDAVKRCLELEIVETAALCDLDRAAQVLAGCRMQGVRIALDDFGTGYSSLANFRTLTVDILKIDRSFVRDMLDDPNDLEIVESIVRLAHAFNREVVAEGVETLEHGAMLLRTGCRLCQGFGIAAAMPADEFPSWIEAWRRERRWTRLVRPMNSRDDLSIIVAANSQRKWVDGLVEVLNDPQGKSLAELDPRQCRFTRWYQSGGATRYGALPEYKAIGPLHERLHDLVDELLQLAWHGQAEPARRRLPEVFALRDRLIHTLQGLVGRASAAAD